MAITKLQIGFAAAVVVVGVGILVVYQREKPTLRHAVAEMKLKIPAAASVTAGRANELPATPVAQTAAAIPVPPENVAPRPQVAQTAPSVASARTDQIQRWLAAADHPEVLRALAGEARAMTLNRFGDLFGQLNLSSERTEAFARLLDEKRQAPMDIAVASYKNGIDLRNDMNAFEAAVVTTRENIDREIRVLLGEAGYASYIGYNQEQGVHDTFVRLGRVLDGTPDVLTSQQSAQLQTLLKTGSAGSLSAQKIAAARAFLSPPQIKALERAFEQQRNTKAGRFQDALPPPPER